MSELYKLKYEVVSILKENIVKGLEAFGVEVSESPGGEGWIVMESDQPSFRNIDKGVLFWQEKVDRIGIQADRRKWNTETEQMDVIEYFIEMQIWKIKVLYRSTTEAIEDDSVPVVGEDIVSFLIGWFNRQGCIEFRKHNMANLYIQHKDVHTYKDPSDASQWTADFDIKIQVVKQFETSVDTAEVVDMGMLGV